MDVNKTIKNLKIRGFQVSHFESGAQAAEYLNGAIKGCSGGIGGRGCGASGVLERVWR